jgi:linoleoyl-CoA desaturase
VKLAKFKAPTGDVFHKEVRKQARAYFKSHGLEKTGDYSLYLKTIILFTGMLAPFVLFYSNIQLSVWVFIGLWLLMGVSMAGIGLSVMHDAVHGAFHSNRKVNDFVGHLSMFFIGGFVANWRIQHNQLHHTYTNVKDHDEDIKPPFNLLRLSPDFPLEGKHKFQHVYAWFLYLAMTIMWCSTKDFKQINRFKKAGFYDNREAEYRREWTRLLAFKIGYFIFFLVLPTLFTPYSFGLIFSGFVLMHMVAGFILAIVFQPAHVTPTSEFPAVNTNFEIENSWAAHQMLTTQNFAMANRFISWYVGGLNFQIEHHLFPNVSHVHYRALAPIVAKVAKEHNLPYYQTKTFSKAIIDHGKMLYQLGRN